MKTAESGSPAPAAAVRGGPLAGITRNVFVAGIVSLLTDISSEMIVPVLPLFLANVLGTPPVFIGAIESVAEATASFLRLVSGWLSDQVGKRKPLMVAGYGLSNLTKPLLALTSVWGQVLLVRFVDRVGKGVRGAPRDALIADSTLPEFRGKAFGFRQALDTAGAAIGPLVAFMVLALFAEDYRLIFWLSAIPGLLSVAFLVIFLQEKRQSHEQRALPRLGFRHLGRGFLGFALIYGVFTLGNSSDAFLILRSQDLGLAAALIPLAYFLFNLVYSVLATPLGSLSDRVGRRAVLVAGLAVFAVVYVGFALATRAELVWVLFAVYGIYYALTEGVARAYVADLVPAGVRGSAMGTFNFVAGVAALPASIVGGLLWQQVSPSATFVYGAVMAAIALLLLLVVPLRPPANL